MTYVVPFPFSTEALNPHTSGIAFSNAHLSNLFVKVCLCILCADNTQMHLRGSPGRWVFFYVERKHAPDQSGVEAGWVDEALHFIVVMCHDKLVFPCHGFLIIVHIHAALSAAHGFSFLSLFFWQEMTRNNRYRTMITHLRQSIDEEHKEEVQIILFQYHSG